MDMPFTIQLDAELLSSAEQEARAHQTTVPEVIKHQLKIMAENWRASRSGSTPITDELRGVLRLAPNANTREILTEALQKKHGG